jgi:hypothetical protein
LRINSALQPHALLIQHGVRTSEAVIQSCHLCNQYHHYDGGCHKLIKMAGIPRKIVASAQDGAQAYFKQERAQSDGEPQVEQGPLAQP